jgi:hypothetical protein
MESETMPIHPRTQMVKQIPNNPYASYLTGTVREKLLEAQRMEEDFDLRNELHLLKARLMEELDKKECEHCGQRGTDKKEVRELVTAITKVTEAQAKNVDRLAGYIPVKMMPLIFRQVVEVIKLNVKDEALLARIATQLGRIRIPADQREVERIDRAISAGNVPG